MQFNAEQWKDEFVPTVNPVIEPPQNSVIEPTPPVKAPTPRTKALPQPPPCAKCPSTMDPAELAGMSFALGALAGVALVLAFSKTPAVQADA